MARTKISEFSATAADNTEIDGIDIAEGCAPSGINNSIRELMSQLKDFQTGAGGDSFTTANLAYTGTLTGGTGVVAIGTNQIYKDATGNVGIGTITPGAALHVAGLVASAPTGDGVLMGSQNNYGTVHLNGSNGGIIDFSTTGVDFKGRILYDNVSNQFRITTNAVNVFSIDSTGRVGIGTNTPTAPLDVRGISTIADDSLSQDTSVYGSLGVTRDIGTGETRSYFAMTRAGNVVWATGISNDNAYVIGTPNNSRNIATERMRITNAGSLNLGTATNPTSSSTAIIQALVASGDVMNIKHDADAQNMFNLWQTGTTAFAAITFNKGATQTTVGNIVCTTTGTAYNTTSDYRLKENVLPMQGALARVAALKPVTYTWKADGSNGEGFIAHELAEVCPAAVSGEKDAVYSNGNPRYQGIDTSYLVSTLVAAIQELKAEFDAYKASHP